jgi:hypothetical protein
MCAKSKEIRACTKFWFAADRKKSASTYPRDIAGGKLLLRWRWRRARQRVTHASESNLIALQRKIVF